MSRLDWLVAQPIAHRGLHDISRGIIENTASAVSAAVANNYAIEVDLQISADCEAMVHHDDALGRLTDGRGALAHMSAAELRRVPYRATSDRMMSLPELCDLVAGRASLVLELKSRFDGDRRLALRVAEVVRSYAGPIAAMSFDPDLVRTLRELAPGLVRGIVAEARYDDPEWSMLSPARKRSLVNFRHAWRTRPQFIAYAVNDLPAAAPLIARHAFGLPLLTWTVRNDEQRRRAARWADQMIFEGFRA
jgi:glycerophosphoryl diester phosphodiesterase